MTVTVGGMCRLASQLTTGPSMLHRNRAITSGCRMPAPT